MGLFFHEKEHECNQKGTECWPSVGSIRKQAIITGTFLQRNGTGIVKSLELSCDEESIYVESSKGIKVLQLNLTVLQDRMYSSTGQSNFIENLGVYQIKLKRKNILTIIFTLNFQTFVKFYTHLAKYTILTSFERHFKILNEIGRGAYSKVYNGHNMISKQPVALKIYDKKIMTQMNHGTALVKNQITNLQKLRKYKLSPLIGVYETQQLIIIVMKKAEAGNMLDYLQYHADDYNEQFIKTIIYKTLINLKDLHCAGFIHRDIKAENIFFRNYSLNSPLYLGDFGCSVMKRDCASSGIGRISSGTIGFVAPEIIKTNFYDEKCDLFSVGSLFYFLLTGEPIFYKKQANEIYELVSDDVVIQRKILSTSNTSKKCKDLLMKLLKVNSQQRVCAVQALNHSYFQKMEYETNDPIGGQDQFLTAYLKERAKNSFQ